MSLSVTVVTVCKDCRDDIKKTMASILEQTYGNRQCIVIDGVACPA